MFEVGGIRVGRAGPDAVARAERAAGRQAERLARLLHELPPLDDALPGGRQRRAGDDGRRAMELFVKYFDFLVFIFFRGNRVLDLLSSTFEMKAKIKGRRSNAAESAAAFGIRNLQLK